MEPFKNVFSAELVACLGRHLARHVRSFDAAAFVAAIVPRLQVLELKARAQLIADQVHLALPEDPERRAGILLAMLHPDELDHASGSSDEDGICGWGILPLSMVVGQHGIADFERSMAVLRQMTKRFSAEFAIRHYLLADQARAISIMEGWITDPNRHVRRLISEGARPRLPWAMRLPELMRDPAPMLPLLERLRDDPEAYVRRSVANHLNDIAKDHPDRLTKLAARWMQDADPARKALLRYACRGLIRQGDAAALAVFGQGRPMIDAGPLQLSADVVRMGEILELTMTLRSVATAAQSLTVDYVLHLRKASGALSPKVFKGTVLELDPGETRHFRRSHRFREVTTRRHYPGQHAVALRINGQDTEPVEFRLEMAKG